MRKRSPPEFAALELAEHRDDPLLLSRNIVQIMQMWQLYQAEVARILGLRCGDVAALAGGKARLEPGTPAWDRARLLVRCYRALHRHCRGDGVAMYHWLHRDLPAFADTPHRLLVDAQALPALVDYLER